MRMARDTAKLMEAAKLIKELKPKVAEAKAATDLKFVDAMLVLKQKQLAALETAHTATITELKQEMIGSKAGFNISDLLGD